MHQGGQGDTDRYLVQFNGVNSPTQRSKMMPLILGSGELGAPKPLGST